MLTREDIYKKAFEAKKSALKDKKTRREMMLAAACLLSAFQQIKLHTQLTQWV